MPSLLRRLKSLLAGGARSASVIGRLVPAALAVVGVMVAALFAVSIPLALAVAVIVAVAVYWAIPAPRTADLAPSERIVQEHTLLVESIEHTPMPFAVYDQDDCLLVCNDSYRKLYGKAFNNEQSAGERPRIHYTDLVRSFSADSIPPDRMDAYVEDRRRAQRGADGTGVDRYYSGFGWFRVTKFATPSGAVAGFAVDINQLKGREKALQAQIERSKTLENRLRSLANTDSLTTLPNRRAFFERLKAEYTRARRYGEPMAVMMVDIDRFKSINDAHGHGFGDQVIMRVAAAASGALRVHVDLIGRVGGEEFAVLLPATDAEGARECAERIRAAVAALGFESTKGEVNVTASFGVSEMWQADRTPSDCVSRADSALYEAKAQGRDRVVTWTEPPG